MTVRDAGPCARRARPPACDAMRHTGSEEMRWARDARRGGSAGGAVQEGPDDHCGHHHHIDPQSPEHSLLPGREPHTLHRRQGFLPALALDEAADVGRIEFMQLLHGSSSKDMGKQSGHTIEAVAHNQAHHDGNGHRVAPRRIDLVAHELTVVEQHQQEQHGRGHEHRGNHLHAQVQKTQGQVRNHHRDGRHGRAEDRGQIKTDGLARGRVDRAIDVKGFADCPGAAGRDHDGGNQPGFHQTQGKQGHHAVAQFAANGMQHHIGIDILHIGHALEGLRRQDDDGHGHQHHADDAEHQIAATCTNVLWQQTFVHDARLLEEQLPWRDGGADVGRDQDQEGERQEAARHDPAVPHKGLRDRMPVRVRKQGERHKDQVEHRDEQRNPLPGPVPQKHQDIGDEQQ